MIDLHPDLEILSSGQEEIVQPPSCANLQKHQACVQDRRTPVPVTTAKCLSEDTRTAGSATAIIKVIKRTVRIPEPAALAKEAPQSTTCLEFSIIEIILLQWPYDLPWPRIAVFEKPTNETKLRQQVPNPVPKRGQHGNFFFLVRLGPEGSTSHGAFQAEKKDSLRRKCNQDRLFAGKVPSDLPAISVQWSLAGI